MNRTNMSNLNCLDVQVIFYLNLLSKVNNIVDVCSSDVVKTITAFTLKLVLATSFAWNKEYKYKKLCNLQINLKN